MTHTYPPLSLHRLEPGTGYCRPKRRIRAKQPLIKPVIAADAAVGVMTDLSQVIPHITQLSVPINEALTTMIQYGVRLLLVSDANDRVIGLITSRDIEGDKPGRILTKAGGVWDELLVADLMTLRPKLEALLMKEVLSARVGDIIATLRQVNRQHALVIDSDSGVGQQAVRGIFSLSQIGLQLGLDIDPTRQPTTYAELEKAGYAM